MTMRKQTRQPSLRRCRRGAALIEFVIVVSLLILMLFGIIEVGLLFKDQATISQAAREAARSAAVGSSTTTAKNRAVNTAAGITLATSNVTLEKSTDNGSTWTTLGDSGSNNDAVAGNLIRATVTYNHSLVTSLIYTGGTKTLTAKMIMRRE
jgi:Flp pilus assembly protein TadG